MSDFLFGPIGEQLLDLIQSFSNPIFDLYFGIITSLGNTLSIFIILIVLYYTLNKEFVGQMVFLVIFSFQMNVIAKVFFHHPRPFQYDLKYQKTTNVLGIETVWGSEEFSFPSGHSNTQGTIWPYLFSRFKSPIVYVIGVLLLITIPFSRSYLGVHWPSDLLIGLLFGFLISYSFLYGERKFGLTISKQSDKKKILLGICTSVGFLILGFLSLFLGTLFEFSQPISITDPLVWEQANLGIYPGILAGFILGKVLEERYVNFQIRKGSKISTVIRTIIGLTTIVVLYLLAGKVEDIAAEFSEQLLWLPTIVNYLSYLIIAFFLAFVIPWVFTRVENKIFSD